ncbi:MAG TPA: T9SS type A sorting domain-containing protein [Bacteroidota bacterium]|nr:T9SS type A sorting domain-containing protein [Bacteroidota bacterium]
MVASRRSILLGALLAAAACAAPAQWVQLGPPGASGSVNSILKSGGAIFASTPGGGVSRSTNGGLNWVTTNNGLLNLNVSALAAAGSAIFAATAGGGVYTSTDGGNNWAQTSPLLDPTNLLISDNVLSLATVGSLVFAGPGNYGAFYSPNSGLNWYPAGKGLARDPVNCFIGAGPAIFAGTSTNGAFRTADTGKTWTQVNMGEALLDVRGFASDGVSLYAATFGSGVFVSTDGGTSWHTSNAGLGTKFLLSIIAMPTSGGVTTLFAGSSNSGLFASTDNGGTWAPVPLALPENIVSALMVDGNNIYAGTSDGVLRSTDAGSHWEEITAGFTKSTVNSLLLSQGSLFASTPDGIFRSATRGASWDRITNGITGTNIVSIAASGTTLVAGTTTRGAFVRNGGDTAWHATKLAGYVTAVGSCSGLLLASAGGNGASWSPDSGGTWNAAFDLPVGLDGLAIESFASSGNYAYGASPTKGFFVSEDRGMTWTAADSGMRDLHAHVCIARDTTVYLSTAAGVWISTDRGTAWFPITTGLENHSVTALAFWGSTLFAGTADAGVYVSTDNGGHWRASNAGLPTLQIKSIATDGQDVWAGTVAGGTCRRSLGELLLASGAGLARETPGGYALEQNYPNPFNPSTRITYTLPEEGFVRLTVFDMLGREIDRLVEGRVAPGTHTAEWHARVASGVYFYRLEVLTPGAGARRYQKSGRMVVLR